MIFLIFGVVIIFLLWFCVKFLRKPKSPCIMFISGEVKGGKTLLGLYLARSKFKVVHLLWKIKSKFYELICSDKVIEEPVFCSNIPVAGFSYVPLTRDIIQRKHRLPYKSVTFISESHLVIDSMTIRNPILNEECCLFYKLYGHFTRGGRIFVESQSLADNHYALKRSISRYYAIFNSVKIWFVGFFIELREFAYSEDNSVVNVNLLNEDKSTRWLFVPWKLVKMYDCYTYSASTDNNPVEDKLVFIPVDKSNRKFLKTLIPVSFRTFKTMNIEKKDGDI